MTLPNENVILINMNVIDVISMQGIIMKPNGCTVHGCTLQF